MKNKLAENMLRFGVKNLKQDDVKKIKESILTEDFSGTFEQCFLDLKAANAAFAKAYAAGESKPIFAGKYNYYYTVKKLPENSLSQYEVGIIGLGLRRFKDIIIPDIASPVYSEQIFAEYRDNRGIGSNSNWAQSMTPDRAYDLMPMNTSTIDELANINSRFNSITPERLQLMLPQYPKVAAALAAMKTNTNWVNRQKFYAGLSEKAKMFYGTAAI